ncbi:MAG: serine hydrolase, partial [Pseudomonadota bacterium]
MHAWEITPPEDAGLRADVDEMIDEAFDRNELPDLHAVLVARHGKLVVERYYQGEDESWGRPLGNVVFGPDVKHDIRSITKSIVGLLYGIALDEGQVPALDRPLLDLFPAYDDLPGDDRLTMTVEHALTMTLGTEWDESLSYNDRRNSEIAMELADDRYRFILDRPMVAEPGSTWTYNGGATALIAHLIAGGTETFLLDYARERLFAPLGIIDVEWTLGSNGEPAAASGLRLRPRDLAKIGQLILNEGLWHDRQIVPKSWLDASFADSVAADGELFYGYQWWLGRGRKDGRRWIAGFGNGGQRLIVIPDLDLVVVVMAGGYNQLGAWKISVKLMADIILPALEPG